VKVLTATKKTQGERKSDFFFANEGELVYPSFVCGDDRRRLAAGDADSGCGCGRSVCGVNTHKGTTTFEVSELDVPEEDILQVVVNSMVSAGWEPETGEKVFRGMKKIAESYEVGDVIERRGVFVFRKRS
jgi:hypothetical protein